MDGHRDNLLSEPEFPLSTSTSYNPYAVVTTTIRLPFDWFDRVTTTYFTTRPPTCACGLQRCMGPK